MFVNLIKGYLNCTETYFLTNVYSMLNCELLIVTAEKRKNFSRPRVSKRLFLTGRINGKEIIAGFRVEISHCLKKAYIIFVL